MLQMYPDCAKGRVSCFVPSLWLILSRARKARQFLEFAETLKVRNWNLEKESKILSKISFLIFFFSFQIISMGSFVA